MNVTDNNLIEAIFVEESKNRFIGKVMIEGDMHECYIPSSSKLESLINLKNKRVLLTINQGKNCRTRYCLYSVFYHGRQIILNLNSVNELFRIIIESGQYDEYFGYNSIIRETTIRGYKADFVIEGKDIIIVENKAIIGVKQVASFPTIHSERAINQLNKLGALLLEGYKVHYNIVALSPFIKLININSSEKEYYSAFSQCISKGMCVNGYNLYYDNNRVKSSRINISI